MQKELKTVLKGGFILLLGIIVSKIFTYLFKFIVARKLGPTDFGIFSLGLTIVSLSVALSLFGLPSAMTRYSAYFRGKADKTKIKSVVHSIFSMVLPVSLCITLLLVILSPQIASLFKIPDYSILYIFSLAIPFIVITAMLTKLFSSFEKPIYDTLTDKILQAVLLLSLTLIFLYFGYGLLGIVWAYVLSIVLTSFVAYLIYKNKILPQFKTPKKETMRKELLKYSLPLFLSSMILMVYSYTDIFMLGYFKLPADVGFYSVAISIAALLMIITSSLGSMYNPILSKLYAIKKEKEMKSVSSNLFRITLMISLFLFVMFVMFPSQIILVLFGESFLAAKWSLVILSVGYFVVSLIAYNTSILAVRKDTKFIFKASVFGSSLNFVLNLFLIPSFGINGAAFASTLSLILMSSMKYVRSKKYLTFDKTKKLPNIIFSNVLVVLFVLLTKPILVSVTPGSHRILYFGMYGVLLGILYLVLLYLTKAVEKREIIQIKSLLN